MINFLLTIETIIKKYVGVPLSQETLHQINSDLVEEVRDIIESDNPLQSNDGAIIALNIAYKVFGISQLYVETDYLAYKPTPGLLYVLVDLPNNIHLVFDTNTSKIELKTVCNTI